VAKGISRKGRTIEIVSTALEEYIPVNYVVVGRSEWIDNYFEPDALEGIRTVKVSSPHHLHRVKEWLDKHPKRYIDTEGNSLNALDPTSKLLMLQIGNADLVFVIDPDLISEFKDQLEDPQYIHVFQNGIHDWKFIYTKHGVHINRFYDTMLSEQVLTSGRSGMPVNLAAIARRRSPYRIITKAVRKKFIAFSGKFTKEMVYYAVRDVVLLPDIMESQIADLKRFNMEMIAEDEFNLIPVTSSMELGGVPFSTKTLRLALLYWQKRQDELERKILKLYDERITQKGTHIGFLLPDMKFEFDVNSQSQKLAALRELGFEIDDVKRETLEELDDPIAELLGQYSEALKINSTYGENMINRMDPVTGRLIVEFNQLGHGDVEAKAGKATTIATGRYSSDFQQLPRARTIYERVTDSELQCVQELFAPQIHKLLEEIH
jgi:DNA polymerase I-like protein with 3'-5' exonuclease and polymerase domains